MKMYIEMKNDEERKRQLAEKEGAFVLVFE
jgi:hypothetical protein